MHNKTFIAGSSHGIVVACCATGDVLKHNESTYGALTPIVRLDVDEWKRAYGKDDIDELIDLPDMGVWVKLDRHDDALTYEPADATYRQLRNEQGDKWFHFQVNQLF